MCGFLDFVACPNLYFRCLPLHIVTSSRNSCAIAVNNNNYSPALAQDPRTNVALASALSGARLFDLNGILAQWLVVRRRAKKNALQERFSNPKKDAAQENGRRSRSGRWPWQRAYGKLSSWQLARQLGTMASSVKAARQPAQEDGRSGRWLWHRATEGNGKLSQGSGEASLEDGCGNWAVDGHGKLR